MVGIRTMIGVWLVLVLAACQEVGQAADKPGAFDVDDEDLAALTLTEQARIGNIDDPRLGFTAIRGVEIGRDGRLYVLENSARQVRVYAADGELLRTIGRPGDGPGEFATATSFGIVGDTLWVSDEQARRITLFRSTGELLSIVPARGVDVAVEPAGASVNVYPSALRHDGLFTSSVRAATLPGSSGEEYRIPRLIFNAAGSPVDTVGYDSHRAPLVVTVAGLPLRVSRAYPQTTFRASIGTDSVHVQFGAEDKPGTIDVVRTAETGDTVFRSVVHYLPIPIESALRDSLVDSRIAIPLRQLQAVGATPAPSFRREVEAAMSIPAWFPPVSRVETGVDGSVWLRREEHDAASWTWVVIRPDGTPRGALTVPRRTTIEWMDEGQVWAVVTDDLGVPWLVRYALEGGAPPS